MQRSNRGVFLLNTMRKSGSHYLMSILANYLWFGLLQGAERLDHASMKSLIWNQPPDTSHVIRLRDLTGYTAWRWEHENPLIRFNNARVIVHTYRNPLDTFVSRYHYLHVNRDDDRPRRSLAEAIELEVPAFAWHYTAMRAIARRSNVHRIAYEALVQEPHEVVAELLTIARLPVESATLEAAIEASTREQVVADERRRGLHGRNVVGGATSSFIRSGDIGEWRRALESHNVVRIEEILARHGVSIDEFTMG